MGNKSIISPIFIVTLAIMCFAGNNLIVAADITSSAIDCNLTVEDPITIDNEDVLTSEPVIGSNSDCNGNIDYPIIDTGSTGDNTNSTEVNTSSEDILPIPVEVDKPITIEGNNNSTDNILIAQPIIGWETISNNNEFHRAINTPGYYKLTTDLEFSIKPMQKTIDCTSFIDGQGHKLIAETVFRMTSTDFDVKANGLTLANLVFEITRLDCTKDTKIINCTFHDCETGWWERGAAIYADSCGLVIDNCRFLNCGNPCGYHGAVYLTHGWANITNSEFSGCYGNCGGCYFNHGGAIFAKYCDLVINHCTFTNCYSADDGGAICVEHGNNRITNCLFKNCYTTKSSWIDKYHKGAGIYISGDTVVQDCQFIGCKADGKCYNTWNGSIDLDDSVDWHFSIVNCLIDGVTWNNFVRSNYTNHLTFYEIYNIVVNGPWMRYPEDRDNYRFRGL